MSVFAVVTPTALSGRTTSSLIQIWCKLLLDGLFNCISSVPLLKISPYRSNLRSYFHITLRPDIILLINLQQNFVNFCLLANFVFYFLDYQNFASSGCFKSLLVSINICILYYKLISISASDVLLGAVTPSSVWYLRIFHTL